MKDGWEKLCTNRQTDTTKIMVTWPWTKKFIGYKSTAHLPSWSDCVTPSVIVWATYTDVKTQQPPLPTWFTVLQMIPSRHNTKWLKPITIKYLINLTACDKQYNKQVYHYCQCGDSYISQQNSTESFYNNQFYTGTPLWDKNQTFIWL